MKYIASVMLALSLGLSLTPCVQAQEHFPPVDVAPMDMSVGEIVSVNDYDHTLTINHGPLDNLGMTAMTMSFKVRSIDMLAQVKPGDHVRFVADIVNNELTVVALVVSP